MERSGKPIHKIRIPNEHLKANFKIPQSNRYFTRVAGHGQPLSRSLSHCDTQHSQQPKIITKISRNQSLSQTLSLKPSIHSTEKEQIGQRRLNLPKLKVKRAFRPANSNNFNSIIKSELGYLNYYSILAQRPQKESLRTAKEQQYKKMQESAVEQAVEEFEENESEQMRQEKPYQQYHRLLMQRQPVYYKERHFRLKHKATWSNNLI